VWASALLALNAGVTVVSEFVLVRSAGVAVYLSATYIMNVAWDGKTAVDDISEM